MYLLSTAMYKAVFDLTTQPIDLPDGVIPGALFISPLGIFILVIRKQFTQSISKGSSDRCFFILMSSLFILNFFSSAADSAIACRKDHE
jgi:hypothetical protein